MNESVVKLAENFIKILLGPLNKNISFSDTERDDDIPLLEYLEQEKNSITVILENKRKEALRMIWWKSSKNDRIQAWKHKRW